MSVQVLDLAGDDLIRAALVHRRAVHHLLAFVTHRKDLHGIVEPCPSVHSTQLKQSDIPQLEGNKNYS